MPTNRQLGDDVVPPTDLLSRRFIYASLRNSSLLKLAGLLTISCLLAGLFSPVSGALSRLPVDSSPANWYYLRDLQPLTKQENTVEVLVVGDVMLGRGVANLSKPMQNVARELVSADLTVGNFEGAISLIQDHQSLLEPDGQDHPIRLPISAEKIAVLQGAGFDVLSLANNHSLDLGTDGLKRTAGMLERAGIRIAGAGENQTTAYQPVVVRARDLRLAFLGLDAVPEPRVGGANADEWQIARWDWPRIETALAEARREADGVIVLVHWGDEYERNAGPGQREAARRLFAAGADAVIGSHPHAVQQTALIRLSNALTVNAKIQPGFVAYSLGNFVFDQFGEPSNTGLALRLFFDHQGLRGVSPLAVSAGPSPKFLEGESARAILTHAQPAPENIAFTCTAHACNPAPASGGTQGGIFIAGQVDLAGDGDLEQVRLSDQRLAIYAHGQLAWESPTEWKVLDAALGDPNNDGRSEVVLALRKKDQNGTMQSHPFLIGFRGGIFRQVWGGSAVAYPILEIETADLDGDQLQELVVLEERPDGRRAVTIWRWNSWVFSQVWSSPPDNFTDLRLVSNAEGRIATIVVSRPWSP